MDLADATLVARAEQRDLRWRRPNAEPGRRPTFHPVRGRRLVRDRGWREPDRSLARVSGVSGGAGEELAALYARSCPRLIGVLTSIGGSRSDAEELAQDAYVKLLARWNTIRSYDDPEAWVRAVAVRMLVSRRRRAAVATLGVRRLAGRVQQHQPDLSPDAVMVAAALRTLPVTQRAVVVLHHVLDLPVEQVAAELHVPVGTVKSRLSRARAALVPLLRETEEPIDHA